MDEQKTLKRKRNAQPEMSAAEPRASAAPLSSTAALTGASAVAQLYQWLNANHNPQENRSHLSIAGGVWHLPPSVHPELHSRMARVFEICDAEDAEMEALAQRRLEALEELCASRKAGSLQVRTDDETEPSVRNDLAAVVQAGGSVETIRQQQASIRDELRRALDTQPNSTLFLVESRTEVFRFCVDLDLVEAKPTVAEEQILNYFRVLQDVLAMFYSRQFALAICAATRCKPLDAQHFKHGYHGFAELFVTSEQALTIRELYISQLHQRMGPRADDNDWTAVVDVSIYDQSGMRMLYCSKSTQCKCKKSQQCGLCFGGGRIYERWRRYRPWRMLAPNGVLDADALARYSDREYALQQLSIRYWGPPTPNYKPPPEAPLTFPALYQLRKHKDKAAKPEQALQLQLSEEREVDDFEGEGDSVKNRTLYALEPQVRADLEQDLRRFDPYNYKGLNLHKFYRVNNIKHPYYIAKVRGKGSQYCHNVSRDHNGNSIWFLVNGKGLYQKCFCRCDKVTDRHHGTCKEFAQGPRQLRESVRAALFPKPRAERPCDDHFDYFARKLG